MSSCAKKSEEYYQNNSILLKGKIKEIMWKAYLLRIWGASMTFLLPNLLLVQFWTGNHWKSERRTSLIFMSEVHCYPYWFNLNWKETYLTSPYLWPPIFGVLSCSISKSSQLAHFKYNAMIRMINHKPTCFQPCGKAVTHASDDSLLNIAHIYHYTKFHFCTTNQQ